MTEHNIAIFLKQLRKTSGFSALEVVAMLKDYGIDISSKTLYGYESGLSMLNADVFVALCRIYKCDNPMDIFGSPSVTSIEMNLIEKYRSLDPYGQETVNYILDRETNRVQQLQDAQKESPAAVISSQEQSGTRVSIYTYMHKIAAAGNGFYFDDIPTETIEAPYMEGADFIIGVSGDSMEPTYSDGDLVYVEKSQIVESGEIGIFIVNGECYIKEAGKDGLLSHNPKYKSISGNEHIICVGKVLGKVPA